MSIQVASDKQDYIDVIGSAQFVVVEVFKETGKASSAVSAYMEQWAARERRVTFLRVPLTLVERDRATFNEVASAPAVCYFKNGTCVLEVLGNYTTSDWYEKKLTDAMDA